MDSAGLWAVQQESARQDAEQASASSASRFPACSAGEASEKRAGPVSPPQCQPAAQTTTLRQGIIICCWGKLAANRSSSERRTTGSRWDDCTGLVSRSAWCRWVEVRLESDGWERIPLFFLRDRAMPSQWLPPQGHISPNFRCPLWRWGEQHAGSVCFSPGATESPCPLRHQLAWTNLHHRGRWDELTPGKHPWTPDLLLRWLRQSLQVHGWENKENPKTVFFCHACLWIVHHYVRNALGTRGGRVPCVGLTSQQLVSPGLPCPAVLLIRLYP